MATVLDRIVASKRAELSIARQQLPLAVLEQRVEQFGGALPVRSFWDALASPERVHLIAEVKKASPSQGVLRADFDPLEIARAYEAHGASCLSVLTDAPYFQGSLENLRTIRGQAGIPLLRKDFILERYQLLEARLAGADAVLLIAECLNDCELRSLVRAAYDLGMTPLVELYEPDNLPRVLDSGAELIGINNRDLHTFSVDLEHTLRLRERIPAAYRVVSESGIRTPADVARLRQAGVRAMLVGESLVTQADIGLAVRNLLAVPE